MLEYTFFCIRPYIFEKREEIKKMITDANLEIKSTKILWLTPNDLRIIYGHDEPSNYFDASMHFMTTGFVEVGVVEGEDVIDKLLELASDIHIPSQSKVGTIRATFGKTHPVNFNGFDYYLNPLHRSRTRTEARKEVSLFNDELSTRTPFKILSDMLSKLYQERQLKCIYNHHIKLVVKIGLELAEEFDGDKEVVELSCWLHDIASLINGNKYNHHIEGARKAEKILPYFGYNPEVIRNVMHCIETHRGSYLVEKKTKEAEIVCSADGIANLSYLPLLCYYVYKCKQLCFEEGVKEIRKKIESSFVKISEFAKPKVRGMYTEYLKLFS